MTGDEFKAIRLNLGMNHVEFARALGYNGSDRNNAMLIKRIERGAAPVMPDRAIKAIELERGGA